MGSLVHQIDHKLTLELAAALYNYFHVEKNTYNIEMEVPILAPSSPLSVPLESVAAANTHENDAKD